MKVERARDTMSAGCRFALFNIMTGVFVERALTAAIPDSWDPSDPASETICSAICHAAGIESTRSQQHPEQPVHTPRR